MSEPVLKRFLLVYGSQTGQAKAIAEEVHDHAEGNGLSADLHCLSATDKKFTIEKETCAVIIVSTTGDGEPPETAKKFWRRLKKTTHPSTYLSTLKYCLLGLGDSNYTNFCNYGKNLDRRLRQVGAVPLMESAFADDAVGLEIVVEPWLDSLWPCLQSHLGVAVKIANGLAAVADSVKRDMDATEATATNLGREKGDNGSTVLVTNSNSSASVTDSGDSKAAPGPSEPSSLTRSDTPLGVAKLNIPPLPPAFLKIEFLENRDKPVETEPVIQNGCQFPSSASEVIWAPLVSAKRLTADDAVKTALELQLDLAGGGFEFEPGDSFGVVCPNAEEEIEAILRRLRLDSDADTYLELQLQPTGGKKSAAIPPHYPLATTARRLFATCCDIRAAPKKAFLRVLADFATDEAEKRRLQELCSRQGAEDYAKFVRAAGLSWVDVLMAFPSCNPPLERILEMVPRLQPRPYSVSSSPLVDSERVKFVFNVVELDGSRKGVCTGWLDRITRPLQQKSPIPNRSGDLEGDFELLQIASSSSSVKIPVFKRTNTHFRLPDDVSTSLILIGPGTGVAPFIGFLQHREKQRDSEPKNTQFGEIYLFYGCRHKDKDYLYRNELERFLERRVLSRLFVTFSRDEVPPSSEAGETTQHLRYVQDAIDQNAESVAEMIAEKRATVFVCGDAKNMAKDVQDALRRSVAKVKKMSETEAGSLIKDMQENRRYLQDVWS